MTESLKIKIPTQNKITINKSKIKLEENSKKETQRQADLSKAFNEYANEMKAMNIKLSKNIRNTSVNADEQQKQIKENYKYADALKKINIVDTICEGKQSKILSELEVHTSDCSRDCRKCAYRDYESSICYYIINHTKPASSDGKTCKHFVDALEFLQKNNM